MSHGQPKTLDEIGMEYGGLTCEWIAQRWGPLDTVVKGGDLWRWDAEPATPAVSDVIQA